MDTNIAPQNKTKNLKQMCAHATHRDVINTPAGIEAAATAAAALVSNLLHRRHIMLQLSSFMQACMP
jgi:hypothetical protein